jgi:hypothetical protein
VRHELGSDVVVGIQLTEGLGMMGSLDALDMVVSWFGEDKRADWWRFEGQ